MKSGPYLGAGLKRILTIGAAAGLMLGSALAAGPASAETAVAPTAGDGLDADAPATSGVSDAGLAEAVSRDLGLTPEEFNAAGELGRQAAAAAEALSGVPGYTGTRLQDGRILVSGSGPELEARVAELAASTPSLTLEPPAPEAADGTPGTELAVSEQQLFQAYVREVGPQGLQAVAYSDGKFVIRAGGTNAAESTTGRMVPGKGSPAAAEKVSAEDFVARFANVKLDAGTDLAPEADLVGGQGYFADTGEICSTGFSAFDPAGLPSVLTAGHCSDDGAAEQASLEFPAWTAAGPLGTFGFSQFGGPGNTSIVGDEDNPANVGTDVAVIGSIAAGLEPQPVASTWNDPSQTGPDVKIIGTAAPVEGQPVCRSGRTSAWSCGTIDEVGIYVVQGRSGNPADLRAFSGFLSFAVQSSGGDSGGPWLSGNYAVGIHAAGEGAGAPVNFAVAATLDDALAVLPGYQLELFLNKPTVTSPTPGGTFEPGQTIGGTVPAAPASAVAAGSTVRITLTGQAPFAVPMDSAGNWQFTAPEAAPGAASGALSFTAETVNGFSASGASAFEFAPAGAGTPDPQPPVAEPAPQPPVAVPDPIPPAAAAPLTPSTVAPAGAATVVEPPAANPGSINPAGTRLANTGADGLLTAAGAALAAIAVGGVLMVLVRRRKKRTPRP
ncbi:S1 family peptidase [Arthrobacter sp. S39]|uniref:S1 family peptidase n=1 Tax=Arthrobacter sp. S39 TaxID=2509720 RepID=UPI0010371B5D|nr:S1 family peptidase [Arthrobacter sp. S39]TAP41110.1 trypsin-like serine protease [Arthrobacter sp. S39]